MKALDYLYRMKKGMLGMSIDNINEAISELEDLQDQLKQGQENYDKLWEMYSELKKQKLCDGCKQ